MLNLLDRGMSHLQGGRLGMQLRRSVDHSRMVMAERKAAT